MISSSSQFEIISVISFTKLEGSILDLKIFLYIPASAAAAANPNGIKTLLPNGLRKLAIKTKPVFSNGGTILPKILLTLSSEIVEFKMI